MRILICVPAYNRKAITSLALESLNKHKQDATIWTYNDWSTEYDNNYLEPFCDKVIKLPKSDKLVVKNQKNINGMGVQHLRWHQFREFVSMDYDALYLTDSDTIHDPSYIEVLKETSNEFPHNPLSLYTSHPAIARSNRTFIREYSGGISHLYTREMVENIVLILNRQRSDPDYGWDYEAINYLNRKMIVTTTSYLEHFGAGGMHSADTNWDHDRAGWPTPYLQKIRQPVINYLEGNGPRPFL